MDGGPVVTTKLRPPPGRPDPVPRPRLTERLRRVAGRRLTLLSAPAGFGKTTVLGEWLAGRAHGPSAAGAAVPLVTRAAGRRWPGSPWTRATTTRRGSSPTWWRPCGRRCRGAPPAWGTAHRLARGFAAADGGRGGGAGQRPGGDSGELVLVLDDYHVVEAAPVHRLVLISGGGSSVMALPAAGISLADKQATNRALLDSGLDIRTMNAVRRHLSAIKGGKLAAAAAPAKVITLAISDIPGDDPAAIASGPTVPDSNGHIDLSRVVSLLEDRLPPAVIERLRTPREPAADFSHCEFRMIATPAAALEAAARVARAAGLEAEILGDDIEGESRLVATAMAAHVRGPRTKPTVFISGGETTVTITNGRAGRGGRNTEFLLALGEALAGATGVWALAADTDGEDGASGGAAGAILTPDTLRRARSSGLDARKSLVDHDSGGFFDTLGDLIKTGPTHTNVNDFRAILVLPDAML